MAAGSVLLTLLIVGGVFGIGAAADAFGPGKAAQAVQAPVEKVPETEVPDQARLRCASCGVIAAIRPLPASKGTPAGFEFTVRLADGSLRLTTSRTQDSWRVGDRIRVMGGRTGRAVP